MEGDREVRRLLGVAAARHRTRPDGGEPEFTPLIGAAATEARKMVIGRRIGLPECDPDHSDRDARVLLTKRGGWRAMANFNSYEGWWDLSLIDDRNERALLSAFVAVVVVWATTFLFALF